MLIVLVAATARAVASPYDDDELGLDRTAASYEADVTGGSIDALGPPGELRPPRVAPCDCDDEALARALASAPPLADVIAAAQRAAGVRDDPTPGWRRRSRFSALVPAITMRAGNSDSWRDVIDPTISHAAAFSAALAWRLDRVVYDPNEPRFAAFDVARRRERRRIAQAASAAYWAWIEASAAMAGDVRAPTQARLALMEAVAHLDVLTATWFSHTLANRAGSR